MTTCNHPMLTHLFGITYCLACGEHNIDQKNTMNPPPSEPIPHGINCQCLQCSAGRITTRQPFSVGITETCGIGYHKNCKGHGTDNENKAFDCNCFCHKNPAPPPQSTWEEPPHIPTSAACDTGNHGACAGRFATSMGMVRDCDCLCHAPKDTPQESILEEAQRIIHGARRKSFGPAEVSFNQLASIYSIILHKKLKEPVNAHEAALIGVGLKLVREANEPHRDNRVDLCGYSALADQVVDNPPENP